MSPSEPEAATKAEFYCPACQQPVAEPLVCGDCRAVICRKCGSVLEKIDELGIG
jgi:transcription initiation factor IIE alpha subunit